MGMYVGQTVSVHYENNIMLVTHFEFCLYFLKKLSHLVSQTPWSDIQSIKNIKPNHFDT